MEVLHRISCCDRRGNCNQPKCQKNFALNPLGDGLAFLAMVSWGFYSALIRKIGELEYPTIAVTRRIYFYGILFLIPVLIEQKASFKTRDFITARDFSKFLVLRIMCKCNGISAVESGNEMDWCN